LKLFLTSRGYSIPIFLMNRWYMVTSCGSYVSESAQRLSWRVATTWTMPDEVGVNLSGF
jgi:hypothetical protein